MIASGWDPTWWTRLVPPSFLPPWSSPAPSAPQNLAQSILPGWIFGSVVNVTEENSGAPAAEAEILRTQSYGRQLGQIADAVEVLIDDRAKAGGRPDAALAKFVAMKAYIDHVKDNTADPRIVQLRSDLENLRRQDRRAYERFRAELLSAPDQEPEAH